MPGQSRKTTSKVGAKFAWAPEVLEGKESSLHAVDVYALLVLLHEMLLSLSGDYYCYLQLLFYTADTP